MKTHQELCESGEIHGGQYDRRSEQPKQIMSNTAILCFVLGWQGGTIHQVAEELGCTTGHILDADYEVMGELCRKAQAANPRYQRITRALKELRGQIDGGEECRGRDSEISDVTRILEGEA